MCGGASTGRAALACGPRDTQPTQRHNQGRARATSVQLEAGAASLPCCLLGHVVADSLRGAVPLRKAGLWLCSVSPAMQLRCLLWPLHHFSCSSECCLPWQRKMLVLGPAD